MKKLLLFIILLLITACRFTPVPYIIHKDDLNIRIKVYKTTNSKVVENEWEENADLLELSPHEIVHHNNYIIFIWYTNRE